MPSRVPIVVAVLLAVVAAGPAGVRTLHAKDAPPDPAVEVRHPALRDALNRIARGSASWREAMAAVAATGRRAIVLTPNEVRIRRDGAERPVPFDASEVAAVTPLADARGHLSVVVVVVNVAGLEAVHERRGSLPAEFHGDLDRILAHEIYGHAVPYLLAGHVSGRCADPEDGEPATAACAIQRENVVRAELRLGRRTDRSLNSLALTRGLR
ncbi:MAG: hypothetical protein AB7H93_13005 [Vicinamibacterales bacterium]